MSLKLNLCKINHAIIKAAKEANRDYEDILLLAVSKGQSSANIQKLYNLGIKDFAESYWQEARLKIAALNNLNITWYFIGQIQTNKLKAIARNFSWVQSVTRQIELEGLAKYRPDNFPALQVCIEVHIEGSLPKSGADLNILPALIQTATSLPKVRLRGFMIMLDPKLAND